ncbi:MAG: glycerate kinase [Candidatus Latescibacterota bacterium]|nr:glycerate kinase [Candidatus Latescibacterota bacterium]
MVDGLVEGDEAAQAAADRDRRRHARLILDAAIGAADPGVCVQRSLELADGALTIGGKAHPLTSTSRIRVVGAGKATPAMAQAVEPLLGRHLDGGVINTKYGHTLPLEHIHTVECGHPIPDQAGVEGANQILACLEDLAPDDLVLCLLSGGGSALLPAPAKGLTLADKQDTTARLLECGASIDEVNAIRKHLSCIKGGQLARHASPARLVTLAISDVIGDVPDTIASGPTVADPSTFEDSLQLLDRYDLRERIPSSVRNHLEAGALGQRPETPSDASQLPPNSYHVIGTNTLSLEAASAVAAECGYEPRILSSTIAGETRHVAADHVEQGLQVAIDSQPTAPPACLISGGETTVTLSANPGKGGRNQEFTLAAAIALEGRHRITVLSAGTDGTDGPTDAAGAIADGLTVERGRQLGLSAADHLARNDAYPFFDALKDLVITGPTGTNVMDLRLVLVH